MVPILACYVSCSEYVFMFVHLYHIRTESPCEGPYYPFKPQKLSMNGHSNRFIENVIADGWD